MASRRVLRVLFYCTLILTVYGRPESLTRNDMGLSGPGSGILYSANRVNNVGVVLVPYDLLGPNYVYYPADGAMRSALPALPGTQGLVVIGQNIASFMMGVLNAVGIFVREPNNQDGTAIRE